MNNILTLLLLIIANKAIGQNTNGNILSAETIQFINSSIHDKRELILLDRIDSYYEGEIKKYFKDTIIKNVFYKRDTIVGNIRIDKVLISDTLTFSKAEMQYVDSCLNTFKDFRWIKSTVDELCFKILKVIDPEIIRNKRNDDGYYYTIVPPIFLRKNTICLFCYDYFCGGLCGFGSFKIYTINNGAWKTWISYSWYS